MFTYFDRDDVAYPGLASFFKKSSDEEREHGEKLIKYQNKRGGKVVFQDIAKPSAMEWGSPVDALEAALELEKTVNQSLLDMHKASDGDAHLCDSSRGGSLTSRLTPSRRSPASSPSGREPDLASDITCSTR